MKRLRWVDGLIVLAMIMALDSHAVGDETPNAEFFENKIRPVLVRYCYECHSAAAAEPKGGLRLDSRDGARRGGESGPAVVPGNIEESLLVAALRHDSIEMPPGKKLPSEIVDDFARWIREGAADPRDRPPTIDEAAQLSWKLIFAERKKWWSLQPLAKTAAPKNEPPTTSTIDRYISAKLRAAKLDHAPPADVAVLLRRLSFVLTGLPPSADQLDRFVRVFEVDAERAAESMVDELLASPHFGEHFARHWMDVVRYSDTYGYEWDIPAKGAWRYRDYLSRAFNGDVGFDQLVREQLAGDLLENPRINAADQLNESMIGPMFFHLGERRHGSSLQFQGIHQEMVNNQIDAFSKAFLATTVACARCHDHKLDAVSQRDYYALASVFMTPRWAARIVDAPDHNAVVIDRLQQLRGEIQRALATKWSQQADAFADELAKAFDAADGEHRSPAAAQRIERWRSALPATTDQQSPKVENVADLGLLLGSLLRNETDITGPWTTTTDAWQKVRTKRVAENAKNFDILADFHGPGLPEGWSMEGDGMLHGYTVDGTPLVALKGDAAIDRLLPHGYHTHALSARLPGAIYTGRLQNLDRTFISLRLAGGDWASPRSIVSNALLSNSEQAYFTGDMGWKRLLTSRTFKPVEWTFRAEIATAALNANFPGATYQVKAGLPPRDDGARFNGWFSVTGIVKHNGAGAPQDPLDYWEQLFTQDTPADRSSLAQRVGDWLAAAVRRWAAGSMQRGDVTLLNWLIEQRLIETNVHENAKLAHLVAEYRDAERLIAPPRTVIGMDERGIAATNYLLDVRGNYDEPGPSVAHDFLEVFAGQHLVASSRGSGRMELAEFVASPRCPLTARVYVNRVWQWVFGTGLSATPDDFGHLGEKPSHPELLDALAREFMADDWSTKNLLRRLVLSHTFRQSGESSPEARQRDPSNRLLHYYPTRRLEAEAIRDSILVASGRLDRALYGPPIDPPRAKEDATKRLFSGPLDGDGRRSLYTKICLMEPPKFLLGFNLPDPKLPTGRRDVTNVPTQALVLLNDAFVKSQAEFWADRLVRRADPTPEARLRAMFVVALGREPNTAEIKRWTSFLQSTVEGEKPSPAELLRSREAWSEVAHLLFNTKEFIYYR